MLVAYEPRAQEMTLLPAEAPRTRQPLAVGVLAMPVAAGTLFMSGALFGGEEETEIRSLESHALTIPLEGGGACKPEVGRDGGASRALLDNLRSTQTEANETNAVVAPRLTSTQLSRLRRAGYDISVARDVGAHTCDARGA